MHPFICLLKRCRAFRPARARINKSTNRLKNNSLVDDVFSNFEIQSTESLQECTHDTHLTNVDVNLMKKKYLKAKVLIFE